MSNPLVKAFGSFVTGLFDNGIGVVNTGDSLSNNYQSDILSSARELAEEDRSWSAEQAQINRDWQERLAGTAYQRAVQDLRSAGLNPYLAYSQGGADTTAGATASYGGIASSAVSGLVNNMNTIIQSLTSRDIARQNNDTRREVAMLNLLGKAIPRSSSSTSTIIKYNG